MATEKKGNHHRLLFFLVSFLSEFSFAFNDECHWIGVDETIYQTFLKWKRLKPQISINAARFFYAIFVLGSIVHFEFWGRFLD